MRRLSTIGRGAVAGVAVLAVGFSLAVPPASAAWQTSASAPAFSLSAATLAPPTTTCASMPAVGLTPAYARISWPAVSEATGYRVVIGNTANSNTTELAANQSGTSFDVTGSLLLTLVSSVLGSLLTGGTAFITVEARVQQWQSVPSNRQSIVLSSVVGGLLGGIKCQGT